MKLHIENLHVTFAQPPVSGFPVGLIARMALAKAAQPASIPKLGDKWSGTDATYGGISLSLKGDSLVHLLLWDEGDDTPMVYADGVKHAEAVNPEMFSHMPTRHQSIDLFERLPHLFDKSPWYWTLTLTPSGKAAFIQYFDNGYQSHYHLSAECRVRAVSEIPL